MFKLAFHTYEAINYKSRLWKRRKEGPSSDTNFETMSNRSDETVMTSTAPDSDVKFDKIEENLNIKLNNYLMKWIIIVIYYKVTWIFSVLGVFLPMMKLAKLGISMWILLPQLKGEFFLYHLIEGYILHFEKYLLLYRMKFGSACTLQCAKFFSWMLGTFLTGISQECIDEILDISENAISKAEEELRLRKIEGKGDNRRDTIVIQNHN